MSWIEQWAKSHARNDLFFLSLQCSCCFTRESCVESMELKLILHCFSHGVTNHKHHHSEQGTPHTPDVVSPIGSPLSQLCSSCETQMNVSFDPNHSFFGSISRGQVRSQITGPSSVLLNPVIMLSWHCCSTTSSSCTRDNDCWLLGKQWWSLCSHQESWSSFWSHLFHANYSVIGTWDSFPHA